MGGDHLRLGAPLPDLWDDEHAASLDGPGLLLYRSNLLGSDLRVTNFGGGNTSAKLAAPDPLTGATTNVLWVKGSGGDIGSMKLDGFSTLYLDKLLGLRSVYRGLDARGRDGRALQPLHVQPQSARNLDRYPSARLRSSCRTSTTFTPTRSSQSRRARTPKR